MRRSSLHDKHLFSFFEFNMRDVVNMAAPTLMFYNKAVKEERSVSHTFSYYVINFLSMLLIYVKTDDSHIGLFYFNLPFFLII